MAATVEPYRQLEQRPVLQERADDERGEQLAPGPPRRTIASNSFLSAPMRSADADCKFREFVTGYGLPDFDICLPDFDLGVISFL